MTMNPIVRLLRLEQRVRPYEGAVPGTQLVRIIGPDGPQWSLGLGQLHEVKQFFTADTIEACLDQAEAALGMPREWARTPTRKVNEAKLEGYKLRYRLAVQEVEEFTKIHGPNPTTLSKQRLRARLIARKDLWAEKVDRYARTIRKD